MKYPQSTLAANGTTSINLPAGEFSVHVAGTWGGGTLSIQWDDGTNSVEYSNGSLTADGQATIPVGTGKVSFVLSGATGPSLIVTLDKIS